MRISKTFYNSTHVWNLRNWEKSGVCEHCLEPGKTQWSNKSGFYIPRDRSDWQELCSACHRVYDWENRPNYPAVIIDSYEEALPRLLTYSWFTY